MPHLNYKHLRYFWAVAKSGSIARAAEQLHVTPQSISGQLGELHEALGVELLRRSGRGLELTEAGRRTLSYADEIFNLGDELLDVVRGQRSSNRLPFRIGIADSVPKTITYRVIKPVLHMQEPVVAICREGRLVSLLGELAVHRLDMVIADRPMPGEVRVKAYNHLLGSSDLTVFGAPALRKSLKGTFPQLLDNAPFLMPGEGAAIRLPLERWFEAVGVRPGVIGEFDDGALLKAFGQGGAGLFVAPTAIVNDVCHQYGVEPVGMIREVTEEFYAISTERRLRHPATVAIQETAKRDLFGKPGMDTGRPIRHARKTEKSAAHRGS